MMVRIAPSVAGGTVTAPPSKSLAHRVLILGALSGGSTVRNVALSEDIAATLDCLRALGARAEFVGDTVRLSGLSLDSILGGAALFCRESGSTLRFLLPICMAAGVPVTFKGAQRLFQRPLSVYEELAQQQGISLDKTADSLTVCGHLNSGVYRVAGNISSQFITGLLLTLPLLDGDSELLVEGPFESASYIDLTLSVLDAFDIRITRTGTRFMIPGGQHPSPAHYTVEGDCSNAAFLEAFNLLGGQVTVNGVVADTLQGDGIYRAYFRELQAGKTAFDLSDCPDLGPVMMALAAVKGGAEFSGTARLKLKESDRAAAMAQELAKCGITVTVGDNTVTVHQGRLTPPAEPLCGHNDHRIVMALSLICSLTGGQIDGAQAVAKSYPDFFEVLRALHIEVNTE